MADALFRFELVEAGGGGGGGTAPATGGGPMAPPSTGARTQSREQAEADGGGAGPIVRRRQKATDDGIPKRPLPRKKPGPPKPPLREPPKPKPPPPPVKAPPLPKPDPFSFSEQTKVFGTALAGRLGFGGAAGAIGTAALPLAIAAGAVAAVGFGARAISRQQAALAERVRPFSADLQRSEARETLRQTMQSIDIARRFGPQLAEAERQRGRLGAAFAGLGASIAGGPFGQAVGETTELGARGVEAASGISELLQAISIFSAKVVLTPTLGPIPWFFSAEKVNDFLDARGIGVDPMDKFKGNLEIFQKFPHLDPPQTPTGTQTVISPDNLLLGELGGI